MRNPRILVTGATGETGSLVVAELLKGYPVRAMVHRNDIRAARLKSLGAEIAVALIDPARHVGKAYRPTGPELLGAKEMAAAIGLAVGRSVKALPTPACLKLYARGLHSPVSSEPQFAPESGIWRCEQGIHTAISADTATRLHSQRA